MDGFFFCRSPIPYLRLPPFDPLALQQGVHVSLLGDVLLQFRLASWALPPRHFFGRSPSPGISTLFYVPTCWLFGQRLAQSPRLSFLLFRKT